MNYKLKYWSEEELSELSENLREYIKEWQEKNRKIDNLEEKKECRQCEKLFGGKFLEQKIFCSKSCRNKWHYQERKRDLNIYRSSLKK